MKKERTTLQALKERLSQVIGSRDADEKKFRREAEIRELEDEIRATEEQEFEALRVHWAEKLASEQAKVEALLAKRAAALEVIQEVDQEIAAIKERIREEVPFVWRQVGSKHPIVLQKEVEIVKTIIPIFDTSNPFGKVDVPDGERRETEKVTQEITIPCIRRNVDRLLGLGWRIKEGEKFIEDEVGPNNGVREPICRIPDCLDSNFVALSYRVAVR